MTQVETTSSLAILVTGSIVFSIGIASTVALVTDQVVGAAAGGRVQRREGLPWGDPVDVGAPVQEVLGAAALAAVAGAPEGAADLAGGRAGPGEVALQAVQQAEGGLRPARRSAGCRRR